MKYFPAIAAACLIFAIASCSKDEELSLEELEAINAEGLTEILAKTQNKPWRGEEFVPGRLAGTWNSLIIDDPKSFNLLVAEQDSSTASMVNSMHDYLFDYDVVSREWKPRLASFEVITDEETDTLSVVCTLRNDLYWSYYNSDRKIKVTSDDVIFWYDEIQGDRACGSSGYNQQFLAMPDGSEQRVTVEKIDGRRFAFRFPRIVADPILATNMNFGPRHIYEPAKRQGGAEGVKNLFKVSVDPKTIPSLGEWFLVEYTQSQRLVYKRNPGYWRKDANGLSIPYVEEYIVRIIRDENTHLLLFKQGETESYSLRPEDLDDLVLRGGDDYTVFNAGGALSAAYWTFNQNPKNKDRPQYEWFTQKEFRQAMSCLLDRDRIIAQVYRGLAEPKQGFFPEPNPYYNPEIRFQYLYDRQRAESLLASIGMKRDRKGVMRDTKKRAVNFDLTIRSESTINSDIASIIRDELSKSGITVNIRILDFQKLVEQLFSTFEWDAMLIGLSGANIFPSQGSNVWPSAGNLHMWYPNQETPATEWEARVDYLYNEGCYTLDREKAQAIWDEFQLIILEQCPVISLLCARSFFALRNRWDFSNFYYDNLNGAETTHIFLKPQQSGL
ncbi:MAG: ABC transporter substrate-binding protein [Treponema sp.]|jgi:peptide/nickel transport system substrate-binding protein|nr:ABC transporter substrate-binding protein [Treponema sp.]